MNALTFMDKQIMELSRSKSDTITPIITNSSKNKNDFIDLMNPQYEEESDGGLKKKEEILSSYDFRPFSHSNFEAHSCSSEAAPANASSPSAATRSWNSLDSKPNFTPFRSYSSTDLFQPDKMVLDKAQRVNDSAILSEIDQTMKKYTDSLLHAIDSLSARLSELESRTHNLEYSVDDLKVSIGNKHVSADGKMRQLENVLLEVRSGVQDVKDRHEVMEGHMQLVKLCISKVEKSTDARNAMHVEPVQQPAASAPPQQSNLPQSSVSGPQPVPSVPANAPPPSQQNIHPTPPVASQLSPSQIPAGPQRDAYFPPSGQTPDSPNQPYQMPPPAQHPHQPPAPAPAPAPSSQPQQYPQALVHPYLQSSQPPQQQPPQFQPSPLGHQPEESPYMPAHTYPPSLRQPTSLPSSGRPHQYYSSPSPMYEPLPSGRSSSGFSAYVPPSGPSEPYPYGGRPSHYGSGSSIQQQPHSPGSIVSGSSNYPQIPTARILPSAIPAAAAVSGGSSSGSGASGNGVPINDLVDKVTNMGFPREHVQATVRKLTENGQIVDLNVVLDKLMKDGDVQPQRGWFGQ